MALGAVVTVVGAVVGLVGGPVVGLALGAVVVVTGAVVGVGLTVVLVVGAMVVLVVGALVVLVVGALVVLVVGALVVVVVVVAGPLLVKLFVMVAVQVTVLAPSGPEPLHWLIEVGSPVSWDGGAVTVQVIVPPAPPELLHCVTF